MPSPARLDTSARAGPRARRGVTPAARGTRQNVGGRPASRIGPAPPRVRTEARGAPQRAVAPRAQRGVCVPSRLIARRRRQVNYHSDDGAHSPGAGRASPWLQQRAEALACAVRAASEPDVPPDMGPALEAAEARGGQPRWQILRDALLSWPDEVGASARRLPNRVQIGRRSISRPIRTGRTSLPIRPPPAPHDALL